MQPEFIPFDSNEDLPTKRSRLSKEEQLYGVFYDKSKPKHSKPVHKVQKNLNEVELEHTYGKGLSMLQKHGYKVGEGLGKNSQGRTEIIGVNLRRKNEGLSYCKSEKIPSAPEESTRSEPIKISSKKKRKATDEVQSSKLGMVTTTSDTEETTTVDPETLKKIHTVEDTLLSLEYEENQISQGLLELDLKENQLYSMLELLNNCRQDLPSTIETLRSLKESSVHLYHELFIHENFTIPIIRVFFASLWEDWVIKKSPLKGLPELEHWQTLGEVHDIIDIWYSSVSRYFTSKWKPKKELGTNIDALEIWKKHIPQETWEDLSRVLLGRMGAELEQWQPTKDQIAVHCWLHPWLALVDLSPLWPRLICKITLALHDWEPRDRSARMLLLPWKPVLCKEWEELVTQHVLPKLLFLLQEMRITEDVRESGEIKYVMDWVGLVPRKHIRLGMKRIFYPKWRNTLEEMAARDVELQVLVKWVMDWKKIIPEEVIALDI